jgi:AmpE protein
MHFLAMIIALLVLQTRTGEGGIHADHWFDRWLSRVTGWNLSQSVELALATLAPVLLTMLVLDAIDAVLFGLLWIAAAAFVLLYSFGRGNYKAVMESYRCYCRDSEFAQAGHAANSSWNLHDECLDTGTPLAIHRSVQSALLYEGYQRWFGVLFYFFLLGPAGALLYRLLQLSQSRLYSPLLDTVLHIADWLPARLLAAAFVVMGDFVASRDEFMESLLQFDRSAPAILTSVSDAALGGTAVDSEDPEFGQTAARENNELQSLLARSAGAWIVVISLLQLLPV